MAFWHGNAWKQAAVLGFLEVYVNLRTLDGVFGKRSYLTTTPRATKMMLWHMDDFSGRQRWRLVRGAGDWYHIRVLEGQGSSKSFLSTNLLGNQAPAEYI